MNLTEQIAEAERHWIDKGLIAQSRGNGSWLEWCGNHQDKIMNALQVTDEYKSELARVSGEHFRREITDTERIILLESAGGKILSAWAKNDNEDVDLDALMDGVKMLARYMGYDIEAV